MRTQQQQDGPQIPQNLSEIRQRQEAAVQAEQNPLGCIDRLKVLRPQSNFDLIYNGAFLIWFGYLVWFQSGETTALVKTCMPGVETAQFVCFCFNAFAVARKILLLVFLLTCSTQP